MYHAPGYCILSGLDIEPLYYICPHESRVGLTPLAICFPFRSEMGHFDRFPFL
jgi:hypothetical protein